jgi:uncharacterized membrane protein
MMGTPKRIYLAFLFLVASWCAGILLAPLLKSFGLAAGSFLYLWYAPICHQIDQRSLHLAGEKLAVCARCSSIYGSFLLALLIYPLVQRLSSPSLPKRWWLLVAVIPMVIDVSLNVTGIHTSTVTTRAVTGMFFGAILPFYLVPPLLEGFTQAWHRLTLRGGLFYARKAQQT